MSGLRDLEVRAAADLAYLDQPPRSWVPPRDHPDGLPVRDVVIVGAGLNGLAAAFGLLRQRITNLIVVDRASAGREGPWLTFARMRRLRTAKTLVGPDLGLPSLSFPAWYAASRGEQAWAELDKATNAEWMDYLDWFRRTAAIPVKNGVELLAVEPDRGFLRLDLAVQGARVQWAARKLVLATGALGGGGPSLPAFVAGLPRQRWAHSSEEIDFAALAGRRVAVLGAGASAFDNAAVALEAGAASVHLFARRARIEQPNIKSALDFSGFMRHYPSLDDAARWGIMRRLARHSVPPPPTSVERCTRHATFRLSTSCPWTSVSAGAGGLAIDTPEGRYEMDFAVLATGFAVDVAARPELAAVADRIALWRDCYHPPEGEDPRLVEQLGRNPYLGPGFEYRPRPGAEAPWLADIHDFGAGAVQSMGPVTTGLNGMKFGPARLVEAIARDLFLADAALHQAALEAAAAAPVAAADASVI